MKPKYIISFFCLLALMFGYNAFLVHRDAELFKAYDQQTQEMK